MDHAGDRVSSLRAAALCLVCTLLAPAGVGAQDQAATVLDAARQALGGAARISAVKTLITTGRTRQVRGNNLVPIEFEIQIELPDKYSRHDEFPAQDAGPATSGFNGDVAIQIPPPPIPPARAGGPPPPTPEQLQAASRARATAAKQDFARLMLGLFASSYSSYPLAFKYAGQAEAPQGKADVLDASGPGGFTARLFIDSQTHMPLMVTWQGAGPGRRGMPPGRAAPPDAATPPAGGGGTPLPENRLYFADYRDVDGLKLPFRIRRALGTETTEETTIDRYRINARTDPRRFTNER
jgi:hypothetical protein